MSFSQRVKEELNSIQNKSNCCKKSYLFGAILASEYRDGVVFLRLSDDSTVATVLYLLKTIYKYIPEIKSVKRGCYKCSEIYFDSKKLSEFLFFADSFNEEISESTFFSCTNCKSAFLRGVFCACGNVSDPQKSYTLEIRAKNAARAKLIRKVIGEWQEIPPPSFTQRKEGIGLFYRNESSIEDFLTACGANKSLFTFYEALVKKNVRNIENRATNCVARNISRSVAASAVQVSAIESLIASKAIEELPHDLRVTAALRVSNTDVTLSELAALHNPPISKSGLNHRLSKIVEEAKKRKLI